MRIHIVGLGPIGCLIAHHLRQSLPLRHSITLVHKTAKTLSEARLLGNAITLETGGVQIKAKHFAHEVYEKYNDRPPATPDAPARPRIPTSDEHIDSLFLCIKGYQTVFALQQLLHRLSSKSTVVLMQNGMGIYEHIVERVFQNPEERPHFVLASINHGAFLKKYMHVVHRGSGDISFGAVPDARGRDYEASLPDLNLDDITTNTPDDPEASRYLSLRNTIAALSSLPALGTRWKPIYDVNMAMRRKVVVNSVINPLTALLDCRNGEIFRHPEGEYIGRGVCSEAARVFRAQWADELKKARAAGQNVADAHFPNELEADNLLEQCRRIATITADNYSSMLMDVRRGRCTEIQVMNGYLLGLGNKYHIRMPYNSLLLNLIRLRSTIPSAPAHL
ncbi:hypothetical protein NM688_g2579 [Phlebia brevispora]|uniref:Uncharacterized protein n=1 Tax=Phlebia brevispora TaxID=194682 RepID=A0ACC1T834_9APHY|nr:hypothetical protein NM688_g2579 [Phlebia brevispora]